MPDRKIFLASSGIQPETYPHFRELSGKYPHETKVGFIITAGNNHNLAIEAVESLRGFGFVVEILDLKNSKPRYVRNNLQRIDVLYVNGGNTFDLLYWMKKSELLIPLQERLDEGMCYYGSSAGSLVAGPNIEMAGWHRSWDRNKIGLTDLSGLGIIDVAVFPHFDPRYRDLINSRANNVNYPIVAITNKQAVVVDNHGFRIV